jgi:hypothetical protein
MEVYGPPKERYNLYVEIFKCEANKKPLVVILKGLGAKTN